MRTLTIFLLLISIIVVSAQKLTRISSEKPDKQEFKVGDQLISTLGHFQLILDSNSCRLGIYQFSDTDKKYINIDTYQHPQAPDCNFIKIDNNKIVTDTGFQIAKFSSPNFHKTWLSIDDQGVIRFIGVKQQSQSSAIPDSEQIILKTPPQQKLNNHNLVSNSQFKLNQFSQKSDPSKKWIYDLANNQLTISKNGNPTLRRTFSLESLNLDRAGAFDATNRTSPFIFFQNALLYARCNLRKQGCQVRAPYTIEFNNHWPVARIYDQERYLIAEYSLNETNSFQRSRICPKGSFLLGELCLKQCPAPYYERIDGPYGQCVLACEEGAIVNQDTRRCSCSSRDLTGNPEDTKLVKKCEREWASNFYGCDCTSVNQVYDRINSLTCQNACPQTSFTDSGICYECPQFCQTCTRDSDFVQYLKCSTCLSGYSLVSGKCVRDVRNCPANCQECDGSKCTKCASFYSLYEGSCVLSCPPAFYETFDSAKGSTCVSNALPSNGACPAGCIKCENDVCLSCAPGYVFFITPLGTTCKLKTSSLTCPSNFKFETVRQICYLDNIENMNMGQCKSRVERCQACKSSSDSVCILCEEGYFLLNNQCVQKCPSGFLKQNNICMQQIQNCQSSGTDVQEDEANINFDLMKSSRNYKRQIFNGLQPSNDPAGYSIYFKEFIMQESTNNQTFPTIARSTKNVCLRCRRGFGLSEDQTQCLPCPSSCQYQHCYFARENSCYKPTIRCTFLDENDNCMESCPEGRYPEVDAKNETRCLPKTSSSVNDYLKVDSSYYLQDDGSKIYFFVLDRPVENGTTSKLSARLLSNSKQRLLLEAEQVLALQKGQYYSIRNTKQNAVAISFEDTVNKFRTPFGFTLANSIYGAEQDYTHNQWMKEWLAHIGFIMAWIILIVHSLYIGNSILYKVDNLIIFCQTVYFFTFAKLLVGNTLAQYYYGWFWMHMGFWPNYFKSTVPSQYEEREAPLSFKLSNLDGNFIRNAGFAVSLFLTFLALWILISLVMYLVNKIFKKNELWYSRIAKNTLIAATQLLSMVIFFFSVTQLIHGGEYPESNKSFHRANFAAAIFFIASISLYMLVRFFFNKIGGLYMFKRLSIALILVDSYQTEGFLALLIAFEVVFTLLRYVLEKPRLFREKIFMICECLAFIIAYILLYLVLVPGVNVLIITVIIFALLMFLIADLVDLYLESRNEYYDLDLFGHKYDNQDKAHGEDVPETERKMNQ